VTPATISDDVLVAEAEKKLKKIVERREAQRQKRADKK